MLEITVGSSVICFDEDISVGSLITKDSPQDLIESVLRDLDYLNVVKSDLTSGYLIVYTSLEVWSIV